MSCLSVHAADDKKNDREARRAQLLEQRLDQERSAWETERAALQKQLADAQATASAMKTENDKVVAQFAATAQERGTLQKTTADLNKQLADAKAANETMRADHQTELTRLMHAREQERIAQNTRYDTQSASLGQCTDKNQRLIELSHGLLQRYRDKTALDAIRQEEPFLGFRDVEIFNQVQDYRDKINAEQFAAPVAQ
jgi:chromosome segregation ATPase